MKRLLTVPALLVFCAATFVSQALAAPITFTFTGTATGTLTGMGPDVAFTDAAFTVTAVADTDNRQSFVAGYTLLSDSASIAVDGVGTFQFLVQTWTFINTNSDLAGFGRNGPGDLVYAPLDPALAGWDLLSSLGPLVGDVRLLQWGSGVPTDGGHFVFLDAEVAGSFLAVVGTSSNVPDASTTMLLMGASLSFLVAVRRKIRLA